MLRGIKEYYKTAFYVFVILGGFFWRSPRILSMLAFTGEKKGNHSATLVNVSRWKKMVDSWLLLPLLDCVTHTCIQYEHIFIHRCIWRGEVMPFLQSQNKRLQSYPWRIYLWNPPPPPHPTLPFNCPEYQLPQSTMATCSLPVKFTPMSQSQLPPKHASVEKQQKGKKSRNLSTSPTLQRVSVQKTLEHICGVSSHDDRGSRGESCRGVSHREAAQIARSLQCFLVPFLILFFLPPSKRPSKEMVRWRERRMRRWRKWGRGGWRREKEEEREGWGGSSLPGLAVVDHLKQCWAPHLLLHCSSTRQRRKLHVAPTDPLQNKDADSSIRWIQDSAALQLDTLLLPPACTLM